MATFRRGVSIGPPVWQSLRRGLALRCTVCASAAEPASFVSGRRTRATTAASRAPPSPRSPPPPPRNTPDWDESLVPDFYRSLPSARESPGQGSSESLLHIYDAAHPVVHVGQSFADPVRPEESLARRLKQAKSRILRAAQDLSRTAAPNLSRTGRPRPQPGAGKPNVFSPGDDGTFWGTELADQMVVVDQLNDLVYYLSRVFELHHQGTLKPQRDFQYPTDQFDVFRVPQSQWVDRLTGLPRIMRGRDKLRWNRNTRDEQADRAWLMAGRCVLNNRKIFQQYVPTLIPTLQEIMAVADLVIYQPDNRFRRISILLDFFEGHRMLPGTLQQLIGLAVEQGHWRDAAIYVEAGLKILEDIALPLPTQMVTDVRNREALPPPQELWGLVEKFKTSRDLLRSSIVSQAQNLLLYGESTDSRAEPVTVEPWVSRAFAAAESPEQLAQLAEDLFFEGLVTQDQVLVETVLVELGALDMAPTDDMWASIMRVAKYSGQYRWNASGPAALMKAYSGSYLKSRMLPLQAFHRRALVLRLNAFHANTERELVDLARWNRLRAIKEAIGCTHLDRLRPFSVPADEDVRPLGLPPLFVPYPELSLAKHKTVLRNRPLTITPKEHYERILRNQSRRWLMYVLIRMINGDYVYRGSRLRLLRQWGLEEHILPAPSKLLANLSCKEHVLADITAEPVENKFRAFERLILAYDDSQVGLNDREDVMSARDVWITDHDRAHTAQAQNEVRALMENRIQVPGTERKLQRQWGRRLAWIFETMQDPEEERELTESLIEAYPLIRTHGRQRHRAEGPVWQGRLVLSGHLLPEWPLIQDADGIRYDRLAPYFYFYDPFSNALGAHDGAESVAASLAEGQVPIYLGDHPGPEAYLSGPSLHDYLARKKGVIAQLEQMSDQDAAVPAPDQKEELDDMAADLMGDLDGEDAFAWVAPSAPPNGKADEEAQQADMKKEEDWLEGVLQDDCGAVAE